MIADDLIGEKNSKPTRYVIDFQGKTYLRPQRYKDVFQRINRKYYLPGKRQRTRKQSVIKKSLEANANAKVNKHHANFLKKWWLMSYPREDMIKAIRAVVEVYCVWSGDESDQYFEFVSKKYQA